MGNLNRQITHYPQPAVEHPFDESGPDPTHASARRVALELANRFKEVVPSGGGTDKVACYFAREVGTGEPVRLKILWRDMPLSAQLVEHFHVEASTASQLAHPHIARARPAEVTDGLYFAVSELRAGDETLRSRLDLSGWLEPDEAAQIGIQIARALDYAHGRGILHLHLQPEHILLDAHGSVLVTDFGVPARLHPEWSPREWVRNGAASYLSPEQLHGVAVDQRSDLYALGALLYEMLSDRVPFDSRDAEEIRRRQKLGRPLALDLIVPGVPVEFGSAVMRLLAGEVDKRFANASEFVTQVHKSVTPNFDFEAAEPATSAVEPWLAQSLHPHSHQAETLLTSSPTGSVFAVSTQKTAPLDTLENAAGATSAETNVWVTEQQPAELAPVSTPGPAPSTPQSPNETTILIRDDAVDTKPIAAVAPVAAVVSPASGQLAPLTNEPPRPEKPARSARRFQIRSQSEGGKSWLRLERRVLALPAVLVLVVSLLALPQLREFKRAAELAPTAVPTPALSDSAITATASQLGATAEVSEAVLIPEFRQSVEKHSERTVVPTSKSTPIPNPTPEPPIAPRQVARLPQVVNFGVPLTNTPGGVLPGPSDSRRGELPPPPPPRVESKTEVAPAQEEAKPEVRRNELGPGANLVLGDVKSRVVPRYPGVARQAGMTGTVVVRVDVDERGRVQSARALTGPLLLRTEAEYAARAWRFEPSYLDGKPATVTRTLSFDFKN